MLRLIIASLFVLALRPGAAYANYEGSQFADVWAAASENPYDALPEEKVTLRSFYSFLTDKLQQSSERTLSDRSDVLPYFRKLLHPNGICLAGSWNITESNPYSGYFRKGSKGLIILRASAALSEIYRGEKRAFGIAGKIFPTQNPNHVSPLKTANFFVIDNLGGTYEPNFLDSPMTNDITNIDAGLEGISKAGILAAAVKAFGFAERVSGKILTVRQLHEISELGEKGISPIITPQWIKIQGEAGPRTEFADFRDDLRIESNGGAYRFDISVSSEGRLAGEKSWHKIGFIEVQADAISEGCDHRIHFHHPVWRNDLRHQ
jgi:hypothetical protein